MKQLTVELGIMSQAVTTTNDLRQELAHLHLSNASSDLEPEPDPDSGQNDSIFAIILSKALLPEQTQIDKE